MNPAADKYLWRGAGVVELACLENKCTISVPRVRIPLSPPYTLLSLIIQNGDQ